MSLTSRHNRAWVGGHTTLRLPLTFSTRPLMPVWRDGVAWMALLMLGGGGGGGTDDESPVHINVLELHAAKLLPQMCHTPISA